MNYHNSEFHKKRETYHEMNAHQPLLFEPQMRHSIISITLLLIDLNNKQGYGYSVGFQLKTILFKKSLCYLNWMIIVFSE